MGAAVVEIDLLMAPAVLSMSVRDGLSHLVGATRPQDGDKEGLVPTILEIGVDQGGATLRAAEMIVLLEAMDDRAPMVGMTGHARLVQRRPDPPITRPTIAGPIAEGPRGGSAMIGVTATTPVADEPRQSVTGVANSADVMTAQLAARAVLAETPEVVVSPRTGTVGTRTVLKTGLANNVEMGKVEQIRGDLHGEMTRRDLDHHGMNLEALVTRIRCHDQLLLFGSTKVRHPRSVPVAGTRNPDHLTVGRPRSGNRVRRSTGVQWSTSSARPALTAC